METAEKKFSWHRLLIVIAFVLFATLIVGGSTYYVMGVQTKNAQLESDRQIKALEKQVQELAKKDEEKTEENKVKDVTSTWNSFSNVDYSIKYPSNWLYKEYPQSPNNLVAFVEKSMGFPPEQSDAAAPIMTSSSDIDFGDGLSTDPSKIKKEVITIGSIQAKKWTFLPGRANDMFGDQRQVFISIPVKGKFIWLRNYDTNFEDIFLKMADSFQVK